MNQRELKELGLKITSPRMKILAVLEQADDHHMSAETVYKALLANHEDISLATVYRVLTQFHAAGLVKRHHFEGEHAVFELDHGSHHDHLICLRCGKVQEFVDETIEQQQAVIAKHAGFMMTDHSLNIYGWCERCKN